MNIKTSYYAKMKEFDSKTEIVSISAFLPSFIDKNQIDQQLKKLAPTNKILFDYKRNPDEKKYIDEYNNYLDTVDVKEIMNDLILKSEKKGKDKIVLLCYEAPSDFCHRHILAKRLTKELDNQNILEKGYEYSDFSKYYKLPFKIDKIKGKHYLAITGHANIEKALGIKNENSEKYNEEAYNKIKNKILIFIEKYIKDNNLKKEDLIFISGMARGVDEIFLDIAEENGNDIILAVPNSIKWHQFRPNRKDGTRGQAIEYIKHLNYVKNHKNSSIFEIHKKYNGKKYLYANFARNDFINYSKKTHTSKQSESVG